MNVLIVDDDKKIRETLSSFLEKTGWNVVLASNTEEALATIDDSIDVVVSDIKMDQQSGIDLLRSVKEKYPFLEVVLMTGFSDIKDSIEALHLRAFAFLIKPFELAELNKTLISAASVKLLNEREEYYKKNLEKQVAQKAKQLLIEKEKLQTIFLTVPNLLIVLDKDLNIIDGNHQLEKYAGVGIEEMVGMNFCNFISCEKIKTSPSSAEGEIPCRCPIEPLVKKVIDCECDIAREKLNAKIFHSKEKTVKTFRVSTCLLPESGESGVRVLLMMDDITREEEMEKQLYHSARMSALGGMASGVAHELNQPLNGISAYIQLIQSRLESGQETSENEMKRICSDLLHEVGRMRKIIDHLRIFYRSGRMPLEKYPLDIKPVFENSMKLIRTQLEKRGIKLEEDFSDSLHKVFADKARLEEVFINLIINARDALERKESGNTGINNKWIKVTASCQRRAQMNGIHFQVSDNGEGIDPENLDNIFDPFYTTKDPDKGTGLGLSICYSIIKDFEGVIWAESFPGETTSFHIWLPAFKQSKSVTDKTSSSPV